MAHPMTTLVDVVISVVMVLVHQLGCDVLELVLDPLTVRVASHLVEPV